jgi:hypothetical protein
MALAMRTLDTKGGTLAVRCEPALAAQADFLLQCVKGFDGKGKGLADGVTIAFGWSVLKLRRDGDRLRVEQPDFAGGAETWTDDVSTTLKVAAEQAEVCRRTKVEPADVTFRHTLVARKDSFKLKGLYLERQRPAKKTNDSGWYVGPLDDESTPGADDLEVLHTWELLAKRPMVVSVLCLPIGYQVTIDGDRIVDIANEKNKTVWLRS